MTEKKEKLDASQGMGLIYDLIYVNRDRILSYLAQLEEAGLLNGISFHKEKGNSDSANFGGSLGVPGTGASLSAGSARTFSDKFQHSYDPAQKLPFKALELLEKNGYLHNDVESTPLGGILIESGDLDLYDYKIHHKMYNRLSDFLSIENGIKNELKRVKENKITVSQIKNAINDTVTSIDPPITSFINKLWGTIDDKFLKFSRDDLILKYNNIPHMPGKWIMVCILDTLPDTEEVDNSPRGWIKRDKNGEVTAIDVLRLLRRVRESFGRPPECYGVTPLMIFREVAR